MQKYQTIQKVNFLYVNNSSKKEVILVELTKKYIMMNKINGKRIEKLLFYVNFQSTGGYGENLECFYRAQQGQQHFCW